MLTLTDTNHFRFEVELSSDELKAVKDALIDTLCNHLTTEGADPAPAYWVLRFLLAEMAFDDRQLCRIANGEQV